MIDSSQFVNGLWMGTILLVLGLVPGLLDRCAKAIFESAATLSLLNPISVRVRVPSPRAMPTPLPQPRWLAALGMAVIALALFAYISH